MTRPAVYILASKRNGTLYTGVTSDLIQRIRDHKSHSIPGFTKDYEVDHLVWFEAHETMVAAITREKAITEWRRVWKIELIERVNPDWEDLFGSLL